MNGRWSNDYWWPVGRLRHFSISRILRFVLERAPVRYGVIHYDRIPEPRRRRLEAEMDRYIGDDAVDEIVDGPS